MKNKAIEKASEILFKFEYYELLQKNRTLTKDEIKELEYLQDQIKEILNTYNI